MPEPEILFPHLPLPKEVRGTAKPLKTYQDTNYQTKANRANRVQHAQDLENEATKLVREISARRSGYRSASSALPEGTSLLLQVDPDADLDFLRSAFHFELLSESENGIVLVTTQSLDLREFIDKIKAFSSNDYGSGQVAKLHHIKNEDERLHGILSDELWTKWPSIDTYPALTVDISVSCEGNIPFPEHSKQENGETQEHYQARLDKYEVRRQNY